MLRIAITGGSEGLGLELSKLLAANFECKIISCGRRNLDEIPELENYLDVIRYEQLDLLNENSIGQFIDASLKYLGEIDMLINNAVICENNSIIEQNDIDNFFKHFKLNSFVPLDLSSLFYNKLKQEKNLNKDRHISVIMISSETAIQPKPSLAYYSASKAALLNLSRSLALLVDSRFMSICTLMLGPLATPFFVEMYEKEAIKTGLNLEEFIETRIVKQFPSTTVKRLIQPIEVLDSILFLHNLKEAKNGLVLKLDAGVISSII